jgi:hypothetical protein
MNFCKDEIIKIDFINNTINKKKKKDFEKHLKRCPFCLQEIEELSVLVPPLSNIKGPPVPDSVLKSTMERFHKERLGLIALPEKKQRLTIRKWGFLFYSFTAFLVMGIFVILTYILNLSSVHQFLSSHFGSLLVKLREFMGIQQNGEVFYLKSATLFLSLLSLLFLPSIIENIYLLLKKKNGLNGG